MRKEYVGIGADLVLGINDGCDELDEIRDRAWLSEYYIQGLLGQDTHKYEIGGKVAQKAQYGAYTTLTYINCYKA